MSSIFIVIIVLASVFIVSPVLLSLSQLQKQYIIPSFTTLVLENDSVVLLAILNAAVIVAAGVFWSVMNKDTRFINRELAKQIKQTVEGIQQKSK